MNVLHISYHTSPLTSLGRNDGGGMSTYVHELCNALSKKNNVTVITSDNSKSGKKNYYHNLVFSRLDHNTEIKTKINNLDSFYKEFIDSQINGGSIDIDVTHAHYWLSGILAKKLKKDFGLPYVYSSHSFGLFVGTGKRNMFRIEQEREVMLSADVVISSSFFELEYISNNYGIDKSKIKVIHPGVNSKIFFPDYDFNTSKVKKVLCVGRIQEQKGQHKVIEFMSFLSELEINFHMYFVGEPSGEEGFVYFDELKDLIEKNNYSKSATFLGSLTQEKLAEELRSTDLLLHTSPFESFGLVAVEANACGTPVLTLNNGSLREIVKDNINGLVIENFNNDKVNNFVNMALLDKEKSSLIRKNSYESSEIYSWEKTGINTMSIYEQLA